MDRRPEVVGLDAAPARVAVGEALPDGVQDRALGADLAADDHRPRLLERPADALAARDLAEARVAGAVPQDDDVAREVRRVRAAQVQQHAVPSRDRDDEHFGDNRVAHGWRQWIAERAGAIKRPAGAISGIDPGGLWKRNARRQPRRLQNAAATPPALERGLRKALWRLLPLLFLCYVVAYIDRANVAIAKLAMAGDLPGFDNAVIGFGAGVFFWGYFRRRSPDRSWSRSGARARPSRGSW